MSVLFSEYTFITVVGDTFITVVGGVEIGIGRLCVKNLQHSHFMKTTLNSCTPLAHFACYFTTLHILAFQKLLQKLKFCGFVNKVLQFFQKITSKYF